jgi:drug/metabolite transporter (DMT)-like permease
VKTIALTLLALIAFSANSILCRLALRPRAIDPATFTAIRLVSGALILAAIARARGTARVANSRSAFALAAYAVPFSFAYLELDASIGALLLFAAVQLTIFAVALMHGERPRRGEWVGLLLAGGGLVALLAPGVRAPEPIGALLMILAGVAWGAYTIRGRGTRDPIAATAGNFLAAAPLGLAALAIAALVGEVHATWSGVALAVASGAIASGLGYAIWYAALPGLHAAQAGVAQLAVPAITALAGVLLLGEVPTARLMIAGPVILGGVASALLARHVTQRR